MADIIAARPGTGSVSGSAAVRYHDEQDSSYAESVAAHLRGWDSTDGAWYRLPVDHSSGALLVKATLAAGSVDIGLVDQGAAGSSAWKVTDTALTDGTQRVGGTVAVSLATNTPDVTDRVGRLLGTIANTSFIANAGTNLNTSALALDSNVTTMSAKLPATLGQKAMTASLAVVLASDQASIPVAATLAAETAKIIGTVNQGGTWTVQPGNTANTTAWLVKDARAATPTQSSPAMSNASASILASNANRLGATIWNEGSVAVYVKLGVTASATSYSANVASGGYYEVPFNYTGAIDGITASGTATLRVTELAA